MLPFPEGTVDHLLMQGQPSLMLMALFAHHGGSSSDPNLTSGLTSCLIRRLHKKVHLRVRKTWPSRPPGNLSLPTGTGPSFLFFQGAERQFQIYFLFCLQNHHYCHLYLQMRDREELWPVPRSWPRLEPRPQFQFQRSNCSTLLLPNLTMNRGKISNFTRASLIVELDRTKPFSIKNSLSFYSPVHWKVWSFQPPRICFFIYKMGMCPPPQWDTVPGALVPPFTCARHSINLS